MINLKLLDTVQESLPDAENPSDLIKAEKILKAQQKINPEISSKLIDNIEHGYFLLLNKSTVSFYYFALHPRSRLSSE